MAVACLRLNPFLVAFFRVFIRVETGIRIRDFVVVVVFTVVFFFSHSGFVRLIYIGGGVRDIKVEIVHLFYLFLLFIFSSFLFIIIFF